MTQTKAQLIDGKSAEIEFAGGSASAPAISFTGDANTGIYSPGADQVAISTNGAGRLFVDANGRILSSSTSSSTRDTLVLQGNSSFLTGEPIIRLRRNATSVFSGSDLGAISFENQENQGALIQAYGDGTWTFGSSHPTSLRFATTPASGTSAVERLRITSDGKVGLGTSSPDADSQLHIVGSSYQPLYVNTTGAGGGGATFLHSGTKALYVGTGGSSWLTGSSTADGLIRAEANLAFATNGNARAVTIDSSQRVGVGTTSPQRLLHVHESAAATNGYIQLTNAATGSASTNGLQLLVASPGKEALIIQRENANLEFWTNNTERARIDSSGRLGIGTSSPATVLNVSDPAHGIGIQYSTSLSSLAGIYTSNSTTWGKTGYGSLHVKARTDYGNFYSIDFLTAAADNTPLSRMRIDPSGRVGIGTTQAAGSNPLTVLTPSGSGLVFTKGVSGEYWNNEYVSIGIQNNSGDGNNKSEIRFGVPADGTTDLRFITQASSGNVAEKARLDPQGRLLVGTSSGLGSERINADGRFIVQTATKRLGVNGGGDNTLTLSLPAAKYITGHLYVSSSPEAGNKGTMSIYKVFIMTISGQAGIGSMTLEQSVDSTYSAGIAVSRSGRNITVTNYETGYFNECRMVFHGLVSN